MAKLTSNQKSIIDELKVEFSRINERNNVKSTGLIDVASLMKDQLEDEAFRREVKLSQRAHRQMLVELMDVAVESISSAIQELGLKFQISEHSPWFRITGQESSSSDFTITFDAPRYVKLHEPNSDRVWSVDKGVEVYINRNYSSIKHDTFEDLVSSDEFKNNLRRLYDENR